MKQILTKSEKQLEMEYLKMQYIVKLGDPLYNIKCLEDRKEIIFKKVNFSAGEVHLTCQDKIPEKSEVMISLTGNRNIQNVMDLLQVVDVLKNNGVENIELYVPYLYYSRQDRYTTEGSPFSLKIFSRLINECGFKKVYTHDLHSDVAEIYINHLVEIKQDSFVRDVLLDNQVDLICAPDAGASKKIFSLARRLSIPRDRIITATKKRCPETGNLKDPEFDSNIDIKGKKILILDDICDGGYTFIQLAKELKSNGAGELSLAVTHGIFSKGLNPLKPYFDKIYTSDSFESRSNRLKIIPLKTLEQ
jgi:ribose-phosphate pyrophosphokinase